MAHLSFQPKEISIDEIDCVSNTEENLPMVLLTACFEMKEMTQSSTGRDLIHSYNSLIAAGTASYQCVDPVACLYSGTELWTKHLVHA